jgi:hypothetical protein
MSRRGRKRKTGKRYACGKLKTSDPSPEQIGELRNVLANQMPHRTADVIWLDQRRKIPERKRSEDIAEHPLGRLCLVGAITRLQYSAGMAFGRAVSMARRVLDCRKPSQSIAGFGQPSPPTPKDLDDSKCTEILADYMDAFIAIGSRPSQLAIKHVVVLEHDLDPGLFRHLDMGLLNLVRHYGLTSR